MPNKKMIGVITAVLWVSAAATICVNVLSGCTTSSNLKYSSSKLLDPASPPNGGFAFALRASTVVLRNSPPAKAGADATDAVPSTCAAPKPQKSDSKDSKAPVWWRDCLRRSSASVVAVSSNDVAYVAAPDDGLTTKTSVTPKVSDSDPLLLTSITFNTTSTIPNAITGVGTGAAAGFAWGPWGAVVGGVVGGIGVFAPGLAGRSAGSAEHPGWWDFACDAKTEYARYQRLKDQPSITLAGPVTLDFIAIPRDPKDASKEIANIADICWNSLPAVRTTGGPQLGDEGTEATGWFYRFVPNQSTGGPAHPTLIPPLIFNKGSDGLQLPKSVVQLAATYFKKAGSDSTPVALKTFPLSACRAVDLQVTWWQEFDLNTQSATHKIELVTFPLTVADQTYVQVIPSPTHGSITLLSVCGGYASSGAPSTDVTDSVNNFIKQAQAIRDAQTKWDKPKK